jgi:hypothetical protein
MPPQLLLWASAPEYFWFTYMPKVLSDSPATQYLMAVADKNGKLLEAGETYKIDVPKDIEILRPEIVEAADQCTLGKWLQALRLNLKKW